MNVAHALYLHTTATLLLHGRAFGDVPLERGIRQGCPLSPLLFAIATHSFLVIISHRHPTALVRAFADDTAMVLRSWAKEGRKVFRTFEGFRRASCLSLNLLKTVGIPLWPEAPSAVRARLAQSEDEPQILWDTAGKYLGVFIGPGKGTRSWTNPLAKYHARLREWPWSELGLHSAITIYNMYILPVLLYVAQVEVPPPEVLEAEAWAVRRLAPGPGGWCDPEDLHNGRQLGLTAELRPLEDSCRAALLRLRDQEHRRYGLDWSSLRAELSAASARARPNGCPLAWATWFSNHLPTLIEEKVQ